MALSAADLDRLCAAAGGKAIDSGRPLFGRRSVTWRVNQEAIVLLGGGRALLLQVAHPLVAAGVADHSDFRSQPLARLRRTLDLVLTIVFADAASALRAVQEIERVHARVRGVLAETQGRIPRGTPYAANDPDLLLWVHATLIDSALQTYERFFRPLRREERAAYYAESKVVGRLLGIPDAILPRALPDFEAYMSDTRAALTVSRTAKEVAASILGDSAPLALRPLSELTRFITTGLLPATLREAYDLYWSRAHDLIFETLAATSRQVAPALPACLRQVPHAVSNKPKRKRQAAPNPGRAAGKAPAF